EQDLVARQESPAAKLDLIVQPLEAHRVRARLETDHRGECPTAEAAGRDRNRRRPVGLCYTGDWEVGQLSRIRAGGAVEAPPAPLGVQGVTGLEPGAPSLE